MTENGADETLLDGELDDNEFLLDNEKEDALLAGIEFDIIAGETYYAENNVSVQEVPVTETDENKILGLEPELDIVERTVNISESDSNDIVVDTASNDIPLNTTDFNEGRGIKNSSDDPAVVVDFKVNVAVPNEKDFIVNDILTAKNEGLLTGDSNDEEIDKTSKISDDEDENNRNERDRFKTERSTILSIGRSGRNWDNLPDSLDDVVIPDSELALVSRYNRQKKGKQYQNQPHKQQHKSKRVSPQRSRSGSPERSRSRSPFQPRTISPSSEPQHVSVIIHDRTEQRIVTKRQIVMVPDLESSNSNYSMMQQEDTWNMQQMGNSEDHIQYATEIDQYIASPSQYSDPVNQMIHPFPPHQHANHSQQPVGPQWQMQAPQQQQQSLLPPGVESYVPRQQPPLAQIRIPHQLPPPRDIMRQQLPPQIHAPQTHMRPALQAQPPPGYLVRVQRAPMMIQRQPVQVSMSNAPPHPQQPFQNHQHAQFLPRPPQQVILNSGMRPMQPSSFPGPPPQRLIIHRHPAAPPNNVNNQVIMTSQPGQLMSTVHSQPPRLVGQVPPHHTSMPPNSTPMPIMPQVVRHQAPLMMRPPNVPQPSIMPPQQYASNMFPGHHNVYSNTGHYAPNNQFSDEPPPPGHEPIQLPINNSHAMNVPEIDDQNISNYQNMRCDGTYGEGEVIDAISAASDDYKRKMNDRNMLSHKRHSEKHSSYSPSKRTRYEAHNYRKEDDQDSWKKSRPQNVDRHNLIELKINKPPYTSQSSSSDDNPVPKPVESSSKIVSTTTTATTTKSQIAINRNTAVRMTNFMQQRMTTRPSLVAQNFPSQAKPFPRAGLGASIPSASFKNMTSGVVPNTIANSASGTSDVPEVHQIFRVKTKGGKVMYKSIPVDPKTLQYVQSSGLKTSAATAKDNEGDSKQNPRRLVVTDISNVPDVKKGVVIKENSSVECESIRQAAASVSKRYSTMTLGERFSKLKTLTSDDENNASDSSKNDNGINRLVVVANSSTRVVNNMSSVQSCKVIVKNIASSTKSNQISKAALACGKVKKIVWNPVSSSQTEAEIIFTKPEEAQLFCSKYNRKMIDLSLISVSIVKE